jgi:hypothetical protein
MGTLKSDAALTMMKNMWSKMTPELRGRVKQSGRFIMTASLYDNYSDSIESLNGSDAAHRTLLEGRDVLAFRGVPIIVREEWDEHIENDFGDVRPHRALLTIPENMVVGTDGISDDTNVEMWFEKLNQRNYFRAEYKAGVQYIHTEFIVAAY